MSYTEIDQQTFESVLSGNGYKWSIVPDRYSRETIYMIEFAPGECVKIFSSIENGISRSVGADAIRVVTLDVVNSLPTMIR